MKPTELRLGNLVMYNGEVVRVEQITKKKIGYHLHKGETRMNYARLFEIEPVPVTEELLLKCGFKKRIHSDRIFVYEETVIYFMEGSMCDILTEFNRGTMTCVHFHDLQNAYYLVTGKELEIEV